MPQVAPLRQSHGRARPYPPAFPAATRQADMHMCAHHRWNLVLRADRCRPKAAYRRRAADIHRHSPTRSRLAARHCRSAWKGRGEIVRSRETVHDAVEYVCPARDKKTTLTELKGNVPQALRLSDNAPDCARRRNHMLASRTPASRGHHWRKLRFAPPSIREISEPRKDRREIAIASSRTPSHDCANRSASGK